MNAIEISSSTLSCCIPLHLISMSNDFNLEYKLSSESSIHSTPSTSIKENECASLYSVLPTNFLASHLVCNTTWVYCTHNGLWMSIEQMLVERNAS